MNIYELALQCMEPEQIDHHESDLYLLKNSASTRLVEQYAYKTIVKVFRDYDNQVWYDVPFAYTPYWNNLM
jgi:hypothetical protein